MSHPWWTVPNVWQDEEVFIVGGSPSFATFDFNRLRSKHVIGCNDAFRLGAHIVDISVFGDKGWFTRNQKDLMSFDNLIVTNHQSLKSQAPWVKVCARHNTAVGKGNHLGWYFNTGILAINLACSLGASTVYLLGYDMKMRETTHVSEIPELAIPYRVKKLTGAGVQRNSNWYANIGGHNMPRTYQKFLHYYNMFKKDLDKAYPNVQIINTNPDSALSIWPKVCLEKVLSK